MFEQCLEKLWIDYVLINLRLFEGSRCLTVPSAAIVTLLKRLLGGPRSGGL